MASVGRTDSDPDPLESSVNKLSIAIVAQITNKGPKMVGRIQLDAGGSSATAAAVVAKSVKLIIISPLNWILAKN